MTASQESHQHNLVHFLLVDDREQNLVALEALLRRDGLCLHKAYSGVEALELLLKHEFALALIDVQMPGMDGFELAELMRGSERTRRIPIIFLTAGQTDRQRSFRGYEAGAVDFLQKPIEPDILKSKTGVFFDLYCQRQEVARQRDELAAMIEKNRQLLEESRQYAQALRNADRRKDEFLATLAHELRNPLAPILNAVQLLRIEGDVPHETAEIYEIIERQAEHMVRLVDDLLEVSRISSGKIQLQHNLVDLTEVARNAVETSRPLLDAGHHQLKISFPGSPVTVHGDTVRLTQVLSNLLNNAAKYTPEEGRIALSIQAEQDWACISVSDSGMGIPPEMLTEVFQMFTQINRHLKRSQGGLGIGLTLVKQLVELHGGTIHVHSAGEDQGTEFTIRLPLAVSELPARPVTPSRPAQGTRRRRVLVIDDNPDVLNTMQRLLVACGHEVATAQNGPSGLEQAQTFQPEAILLDLGMPVMDGYETARQLRKLIHPQRCLLVAVTGWGQVEDRKQTQLAGFDLHAVKPISMAKIQEVLHTLNEEPAAKS